MACLQSWVSEEDFGCPTIPCPNCGRPFPVSRAAREKCLVAVRALLAKNCTASSRCKTSSSSLKSHAEDPPKKRQKKLSRKKLVGESSDEGPPLVPRQLGYVFGREGLHDLDQVQKEREAAGLPPPWWEANTWLEKNEHKYLGGKADAKDGPSCSSSASASMLEKKQRLEKGGEADAEDGPSCSSSTSASMVYDSVKPMCNSEAEADVWF